MGAVVVGVMVIVAGLALHFLPRIKDSVRREKIWREWTKWR